MPIAPCSAVLLDVSSSSVTVFGKTAAAVRLLAKMLPVGEDDERAVPDASQKGFRVERRVQCALSPDGELFKVTKSGVSSSVQWLMTAPGDAQFFLTVKPVMTNLADISFNVVAYLATFQLGDADFQRYVQSHVQIKRGPEMDTASRGTPQSRKDDIDAKATRSAENADFTKRRKLTIER